MAADQERATEETQKQALWNAMIEFALQPKYEADFATAAKFLLETDELPDPADPEGDAEFGQAFDYFLFDYRLPDDSRIVERFARERGRTLTPRQRAWLADWVESAPRLVEIIGVERDKGVTAYDLRTHETYDIRDIEGSRIAARWAVAFLRVLKTDDHYEFGGTGLNVPPAFRGFLLGYVQGLHDDYMLRYPEATEEQFLRAHTQLIFKYILEEIEPVTQAPRLILTPEGDPTENAVATFDVLDQARALAQLRAAQEFDLNATGDADVNTFTWHEADESLAELRAQGAPFDQKPAAGMPGGKRVLGMVFLDLNELRLEVMSRRRLEAGKAILTRQLGDAIRFREEEIKPLAETLAALDADEPDEIDDELDDELDDETDQFDGESGDELGNELGELLSLMNPASGSPRISPEELAAQSAQMTSAYYAGWVDTPVLALGKQTPREAVATFSGRIQVIRMLKGFEAREGTVDMAGMVRVVDWNAVARELGLTEQEFLDETSVEDRMYESLSRIQELNARHQPDAGLAEWKTFRKEFPIQRAEELEFADAWDLEEIFDEVAMELEYQLVREKRFDDAQGVVEDYIALEGSMWGWAMAERAAIKIERAIFNDPQTVQEGAAELEELGQGFEGPFDALVMLADLQQGLLNAPDAVEETLERADEAAEDDTQAERVYDMLLEYYEVFRKCDAGIAYWHRANDELERDEKDVLGLMRLLLACDELEQADAVLREMVEDQESKNYFAGRIAARRGDRARAGELWQEQLARDETLLEVFWFDWAELNLLLGNSAAVLEKLDTIQDHDHYLAHWFRAMAYGQQNDLDKAGRAADQARAAMLAQTRRMDYAPAQWQQRAYAHEFGLSDAAVQALRLDTAVE